MEKTEYSLVRTGLSTLVVAIPHRFCKEHGLEPRDKIRVITDKERVIITLIPRKQK